MSGGRRLEHLLRASAARAPERVAVIEAGTGRTITYGELDRRTDELAARLKAAGVQPGDRVAQHIPKSIDSIVALFSAMKAGAAYVPLDPSAPQARNDKIIGKAGAAAVVRVKDGEHTIEPRQAEGERIPDLSYILFTSGSTGEPKGVAHTHASALSFVDWSTRVFEPVPDDRFASNAPFHFDLSIFDIYVPIGAGATLVLFDEGLARFPQDLARITHEQQVTVWYSTPSTLRMLLAWGKLERFDYSSLKHVVFAGEVFAAHHLAEMKKKWPSARWWNLYGPTETNVCNGFEVPQSWDPERKEPFPIGPVCDNDEGILVDREGNLVPAGGEGELCIRGGTVMLKYWGEPEMTARAFLEHGGHRWYKTGDLCKLDADGNYVYLGRRDRMVKRLGYRIELSEIEAVLGRHPAVGEVAAIAKPDADNGVQIRAYLVTHGGVKPSLVELRTFCATGLPPYMIPDKFTVLPSLPRTSTDKTDYRALEGLD